MSRVSSVMTLWSFTRFIWGVATLLVFIYKIELLQDSNTPFWSFVVLLLLFFVCEILPIVALLDYSYLPMVGIEQVEIRWAEDETSQASARSTLVDPLFANTIVQSASPARSVRWRDEIVDPLLPAQTSDTTINETSTNNQ